MSLNRLQTAIADFLQPRLNNPTMDSIGGGVPRRQNDLPAIVISMEGVDVSGGGLGGHGTGERTGALEVRSDIDLSDPVLRFPDGTVELLSPDRRVLTLPHGGLVATDGDPNTPITEADITVERNGNPLTLVPNNPGPNEFTLNRVPAELTFGAPLPGSGTITARHRVGRWEEETIEMAGTLHLDLYAGSVSDIEATTNQIYTLLTVSAIPGLRRLAPMAMGPIDFPERPGNNNRYRRLSFAFAYEYTEPRLPTGGGIISTIDATSRLDGGEGEEQETLPLAQN
jgi:hypothetical protein